MARRKQKIRRYHYVGNYRKSRWRRISRLLTVLLVAAALFWVGWMVASQGVDALTEFWYANFSPDRRTGKEESETEVTQQPEEQPQPESKPQPAPPAKPEKQPEDTDGVFAQIPLSALNSEDALRTALQTAKLAGADRALLTLKDERGYIYYDSHVALAQTAGAVRADVDLALFVRLCGEENLKPCARIYVFRDPLAPYADRAMAVCFRQEGVTWLDNYKEQGGQPWLNPYSAPARQYAADLAKELTENGLQEIVFAAVQFPDGYSLGDCYYGEEAAALSRTDCLAGCVAALQDAVGEEKAWFQYTTAQAFYPDAYVVGEGGVPALAAHRVLLTVVAMRDGEGQWIWPECDEDLMNGWSTQTRSSGTDYLGLDCGVLAADPQLAGSWQAVARQTGFTFFVQ